MSLDICFKIPKFGRTATLINSSPLGNIHPEAVISPTVHRRQPPHSCHSLLSPKESLTMTKSQSRRTLLTPGPFMPAIKSFAPISSPAVQLSRPAPRTPPTSHTALHIVQRSRARAVSFVRATSFRWLAVADPLHRHIDAQQVITHTIASAFRTTPTPPRRPVPPSLSSTAVRHSSPEAEVWGRETFCVALPIHQFSGMVTSFGFSPVLLLLGVSVVGFRE